MAQIISPAHGLQPFPSLSPVYATTPPLPFPLPAIQVAYPPSPEISESSTGSSTSTIRGGTVAWPKRTRQADDLHPTFSPPRSEPTAAASTATSPVGKVAQHQPVLPGKPGTLRLNLDLIKRTLSESHIIPTETLVRKKSGQVVKSSLKPHARTQSDVGLAIKSAPTTPIERKTVQFDAKLEHVRLFLAEQKPLAVSRGGSPTLDTSDADEFPFPPTERRGGGNGQLSLKFVKMPSLPQPALDRDVYLEDLQLAADAQSLNGIVQVRNIAFAKWIAVRFTFDWWQTTSEVTARYLDSVRNGTFDRFSFTIRLGESQSRIAEKVLFLAIRYSVDGKEIWDNNAGENYQVHFEIKKTPAAVVVPAKAAATTTLATNGNEAQVADFRRELEKVAADKQTNVRTWVGQQAASSAAPAATVTSPVTSPKASRPSFLASHRYSSFPAPSAGSDPRRKVPDPSSLKQRYDFGASLRSVWSPPDLRSSPTSPHRSTVSYPMGSAVPFPSTAQQQQHTHAVPFPSPNAGTERPFAARRAGALSPGRGSPRDADDLLPRFTLDPERDYRSPPPAPQLKPVADDGLARPSRPRNHQRSYFDSWAAQHMPPAVKKTPLSSNVPTTAPVADGPPPALEESSSSSSDTETDTTEDEDREMSTPRMGNVQPATPTMSPSKKEEDETAAFSRLARSPSNMALRHGDAAANALSPSWSGAMSLSPSDSSLESTPSATLASSPAQSPLSPPLESMPLYDDGLSIQGDRDSTHYNFFLNRFCFFTGVPGTPEGYLSQRRAQSASGVDYTRTPRGGKQQEQSPSTDPRSPTQAEMNHYGFPSNLTSALGIHSKMAGDVSPPAGATTPTATAADATTPRPETPASIALSPISSVPVAG